MHSELALVSDLNLETDTQHHLKFLNMQSVSPASFITFTKDVIFSAYLFICLVVLSWLDRLLRKNQLVFLCSAFKLVPIMISARNPENVHLNGLKQFWFMSHYLLPYKYFAGKGLKIYYAEKCFNNKKGINDWKYIISVLLNQI